MQDQLDCCVAVAISHEICRPADKRASAGHPLALHTKRPHLTMTLHVSEQTKSSAARPTADCPRAYQSTLPVQLSIRRSMPRGGSRRFHRRTGSPGAARNPVRPLLRRRSTREPAPNGCACPAAGPIRPRTRPVTRARSRPEAGRRRSGRRRAAGAAEPAGGTRPQAPVGSAGAVPVTANRYGRQADIHTALLSLASARSTWCLLGPWLRAGPAIGCTLHGWSRRGTISRRRAIAAS